MQNAATRSPGSKPLPFDAERTTPPTSLPGTNGRSGLTWYMPRVCSTSGNDTPAACTSTSTPLPGDMKCEGSGSGMSTSRSAVSGPLRSVICIALTGARSYGAVLPHRDYTRRRLARLEQHLAGLVYSDRFAVESLELSPAVDRISHADAQALPYRPVSPGERLGPLFATYWLRVAARVPDGWAGVRVDLLLD